MRICNDWFVYCRAFYLGGLHNVIYNETNISQESPYDINARNMCRLIHTGIAKTIPSTSKCELGIMPRDAYYHDSKGSSPQGMLNACVYTPKSRTLWRCIAFSSRSLIFHAIPHLLIFIGRLYVPYVMRHYTASAAGIQPCETGLPSAKKSLGCAAARNTRHRPIPIAFQSRICRCGFPRPIVHRLA